MFTLAIPTFDDFNSLSCCLVANLNQPLVTGAVVVDNSPNSPQGKLTAAFCGSLGVTYIPYAEAVGTAAAKERAIRAAGPGHVICMDSHVILMPGATTALSNFYLDGGNGVAGDLIHGPLMHDNLKGVDTHFVTEWDEVRAGAEVARLRDRGYGPDKWADVVPGGQLWSEGMWGQWGTDPRVQAHAAFQIGSMGMGCFAVTGETWQGFHPDMRGFGGEEGYMQAKYRKAGKRVWCVSGFRWWHRFAKAEGSPHVVRQHDKYRNYLLGFREVGLDETALKRHFRLWLTEDECRNIEDGKYDPTKIQFTQAAPAQTGCNTCGGGAPNTLTAPATLAEAVELAGRTGSDINEHVPTLCEMAKKADGCLDVGSRVASSLALAGTPGVYHHIGTLSVFDRQAVYKYRAEPVAVPPSSHLPEYDLVFIDTDPHDADVVYAQLEKFGSRSRHHVVLHDTVSFGEQGSSGGPGVLPAVRRWVQENPKWTVTRHYRNNNGLLVLSCREEDKKKLPPLWKQGVNALKAVVRNGANVLVDPGPLKDTPAQDGRLALCMLCPSLNDGKCGECSCPVDKKTTWPKEFCPLGHWHAEAEPA